MKRNSRIFSLNDASERAEKKFDRWRENERMCMNWQYKQKIRTVEKQTQMKCVRNTENQGQCCTVEKKVFWFSIENLSNPLSHYAHIHSHTHTCYSMYHAMNVHEWGRRGSRKTFILIVCRFWVHLHQLSALLRFLFLLSFCVIFFCSSSSLFSFTNDYSVFYRIVPFFHLRMAIHFQFTSKKFQFFPALLNAKLCVRIISFFFIWQWCWQPSNGAMATTVMATMLGILVVV